MNLEYRSECCLVEPEWDDSELCDTKDLGICPKCQKLCNYIDISEGYEEEN